MFVVYIVVFIILFVLVSVIFGANPVQLAADMLVRLMSGIVFISVCNYLLFLAGKNFHVNINETSIVISAVLGISGVCFLYLFQWILTIM